MTSIVSQGRRKRTRIGAPVPYPEMAETAVQVADAQTCKGANKSRSGHSRSPALTGCDIGAGQIYRQR